MSTAVPKVWGKIYAATAASTVAYGALASLAVLPRHVRRLEWTVVELGAGTPTCRLYGQRVSDDRWVPLGDSLRPAASGAESSGVLEIPTGMYDAVAFTLSALAGAGVALEILAEYDGEAQ